jgi:Tol biopolymer transport system component
MNAILKEEPAELRETNAKISPQIEKLVRRCLEKKPERRFQTASDLGFALEALSLSSSSWVNRAEMATAPGSSAWSKSNGLRERIWMIVAGGMALALLAFGIAYFRRPAQEAEPMRMFVNPPEKATRFDLPTISPDGRTLAFVATVEGKTQLWMRQLNSTSARPLAEVGNVSAPFWSADSRFIGFIEENKLKKIALASGTPETLCDIPGRYGAGAWNREGVILFSGVGTPGIWRISDIGGAMAAVTTVDFSHGETGQYAPVFLPDGRHFLFHKATTDLARRGAYLASLDGGEPSLLLQLDNPVVGVVANPAARNEGYLVFARQGALLAQSLDLSQYKLLGEPLHLAQQVRISTSGILLANNLQASLSANGVLVLIEGYANHRLTWFDRAGKKLGTVGPAGNYLIPRLSPDGQRLAVDRIDLQSQTSDIYLFDSASENERRFTFDPAIDEYPFWSPDGSHIVWASTRDGVGNLYQKAANGAGPDEELLRSDYMKHTTDWSADGRFILYSETNPQTNADLWVLPLEGGKPWPWLKTPYIEPAGRFSPDGKWIAYQSNDSGQMEIYLQAFAPGAQGSGGRWQLSINGGTIPLWRRDGRELYYISLDKRLMAVEVTLGAEVKRKTPKELFALNNIGARLDASFAVTRDGQRFLFVTGAEETRPTPFTVLLNWMAEVKK